MADDDDYSKTPVSLTEHRARKEDRASLWSVRDALINTLRRIDAGEFKALSMAMVIESEDSYLRVVATPDHDKTIALMYRGLREDPA